MVNSQAAQASDNKSVTLSNAVVIEFGSASDTGSGIDDDDVGIKSSSGRSQVSGSAAAGVTEDSNLYSVLKSTGSNSSIKDSLVTGVSVNSSLICSRRETIDCSRSESGAVTSGTTAGSGTGSTGAGSGTGSTGTDSTAGSATGSTGTDSTGGSGVS
uniref:ORF105 n=1 Tax=Malaco herpesvirus 1 TaxID=3031797 RepID=A0AA48P965_9VIRU|nr:TPA_asm: ORF105 [Malaco herpesvirus 1]